MNGYEGWYISMAPLHYRCVKCFVPNTRSEVTTDTVVFLPKQIKFPQVSINNLLMQATFDIISLLTNPPPSTVPSLQAGSNVKNAILQLATILNTNPLTDSELQRATTRTTAAAASLHTKQKSSQPSINITQTTSSPRASQPITLKEALD